MTTSILPPNATRAERAVDEALEARLPDPSIIANLFNPDLCPISHLPWLAWALSVEDWKSNWPESVKRDAIKQSIKIHEVLGTRGAVERAIARVWGDSKLQEWFEYNGQPYHFRVDVFVQREGLDATAWNALDEHINQAKNVRSVLDAIRVYLSQTLSRATRLVPICAEIMTLMPPVLGNVDQVLPHYAAMTTYDAETTSIYPQGAVI